MLYMRKIGFEYDYMKCVKNNAHYVSNNETDHHWATIWLVTLPR